MMISIQPETIERLYKIEKKCIEFIKWKPVINNYEHFKFRVPIISINNDLLYWNAYYQKFGSGTIRYGFTLMYSKYCIRSWDMAKKHYSKKEGRYIRGVGRHKHYYLDYDTERDTYEIPEGEISIIDCNQAVNDFANECNIKLIGGYQNKIFF